MQGGRRGGSRGGPAGPWVGRSVAVAQAWAPARAVRRGLRGREHIFRGSHTNRVLRDRETRPSARRRARATARRPVGLRRGSEAQGAGPRGAAGGPLMRSRNRRRGGAALLRGLRGREHIFRGSHTNRVLRDRETRPSARRRARATARRPVGLRRGQREKAGQAPRTEQQSPCGGVVRVALGTSPRAAFAGRSSVPFHTSPLSRGALRSAGAPTIAASTTPAPWPSPTGGVRQVGGSAASGKTPFRRKGIPRVRRGVGYVGAWRFARPYLQPPGVPTGWGSRTGRTSRAGLLLGRLGGVFGARTRPALAGRQRSGEFRRGKQM